MEMEITLQWFAGFVDGEGCVRLFLHPNHYSQAKNGRRGKRYTAFRITLQIGNTHLPTLKLIQQTFGGSLTPVRRKRENPNANQAYMLTWTQRQAIELLQKVYPFLVTKREQVGVLLAAWQPSTIRGKKLPQEIVDLRMQAISKMQELKKIEYPSMEVN